MGRVDWNRSGAVDAWPPLAVSSRMGRVDWNRPRSLHSSNNSRLFPYGKSGLKYIPPHVSNVYLLSLPVWEEWIEISTSGFSKNLALVSSRMGRVDWNVTKVSTNSLCPSLFPYGKSGLKLLCEGSQRGVFQSLPVWEEWIEIFKIASESAHMTVSSRMGRVDWNGHPLLFPPHRHGLFPYGKSGLKSERDEPCSRRAARLFPYGKSGLKLYDRIKHLGNS